MEVTDEVRDVGNSVAVSVLEELLREGQLTRAQVDLYRSKYAKLHELVLQTYEAEKLFLRKAKDLNHQLTTEKIRLERTTIEQSEDAAQIQTLNAQLKRTLAEYDAGSEREAMLQMQLSELEHEKRELEERLLEREQREKANAEPLIQRTQQEVELCERELEAAREQKQKLEVQIQEQAARQSKLTEELETNRVIRDAHERDYKKIAGDPDRLHKQADKFASAVSSLSESQRQVEEDVKKMDERLEQLTKRKEQAEASRRDKDLLLEISKSRVTVTMQNASDVKRRLDKERALHTDTVAKRVKLDWDVKVLSDEYRMGVDDLAQKQKQLERLKRDFKKKELQRDAVKESMPALHQDRQELAKQTKHCEDELRRQKQLLEEIQGEVDLFIGAYLKQEQMSKDKKDKLDTITKSMDLMQKELNGLRTDEQALTENFKFLSSQREKMARESSNASRLCRQTLAEVQMKALEEFDLRKKLAEITHRQKEFGTMYEIVKNERNKYVAKIQESSQDLSEKKEKLKILQNEVEILRMESAAKDKQLSLTRTKANRDRVHKEQLRTDHTRVYNKGTALNEQVEQFVIEIDKLNSILNAIEKEMVVLKRNYEKAVEARNFTGIQLIDRNDELCILWEKSNIQEKLLKKGEDAMLSKDEEIRVLQIELLELERQLQVLQKRIPDVPKLGVEVQKLRTALGEEAKQAKELSEELENPASTLRKWRQLPGCDPDQETLMSKIQFLEERLNDKKEQLLEKELILEEVTTLSDKLRSQALEGRQGTLELSQKVNAFQARIKDVTRKMMATVSELSMYQATGIKLKDELAELNGELEAQQMRVAEGLPPYEDALPEFERLVFQEQKREQDREEMKQRREQEALFLSSATRTMAEPRVNAYIPQNDELGLPRAYGAHQPFLPTPIGSNARHIRKPQPKPIEI